MLISLPTRGRVGRQTTLRSLPAEYAPFVHLWCPKEELAAHKKEPYAAKVAAFHEAPLGTSASRQAQIEWAYNEEKVEWLWFMDDDLQFSFRYPGANCRYKRGLTLERFDALLARLASFFVPNVAMIGITRQGTYFHNPLETETETQTFYGTWVLHLPTVFREGLRFDEFGPLFSIEDYAMRLNLIERGYRTLALTDFAFATENNAPGGCSLYRDAAFQAECTYRLVERWPEFVSVGKGNEEWNAVNPRVNWKKAVAALKPTS
jgi:hypothetical protein